MIKNKTKKTKFLNIFSIILILSLIFLIVFMPEKSILTFSQGIIIWGTKILPALLPFFILTNLLSYTSFTKTVGKYLSPITNRLYGVGGVAGYIYIMSILSGYPVGAKLTADLYKQGIINKNECITISSFTSTSGPLFIIGTIGIGFFHNQKLGILLLLSHILGALLTGLLFRNKNKKLQVLIQTQTTTSNVLSNSMTNSISSIMTIGGFVTIFYMFLQTLLDLNAFELIVKIFEIFNINKEVTISIISGLIEVTTGSLLLSNTHIQQKTILSILSFIVSFGGLSIHAQAYCFLKEFNMPYRKFFLQKLSHAIISVFISIPISYLL